MFKILDGREYFYQWDTGRKLIVKDSTIKEVHFCNRFGNCSLIRATYEVEGVTVVDVPNVILQDSFNLHAYGYDVNYTKYEGVFDIKPRTKPENYVNTEEEHRVWDELEQKLIDLESIVSGEGIAAAVEKWLQNNPVQPGATREEAAQIEQNKGDIAKLQEEVAAIEVPSIEGLATVKYVDDAIADIDIPEVDLTGYATEKYVDDKVANIKIPEGGGGSVDLTGYATEQYVDETAAAITKQIPSIEGLATQTYVDGKAQGVYNSVTRLGYATETYVDGKVGEIEIPDVSGLAPAEHEHEEYQTADEVQALIDASIGEGGGSDGGSVAVDNKTIIQNGDGTISAVVGGGRTETVPATDVITYSDATGVSNEYNNSAVIKIPTTWSVDYNLIPNYSFSIAYKINHGEWVERTLVWEKDYSSQHYFNFAETEEYFNKVRYDKSKKQFWLYIGIDTNKFYNTYYVTDFVVTKHPEYDYEPIKASYVPLNPDAFNVNQGTGLFEPLTGTYLKANEECVYHFGNGNKDYNITNCQRFIGLGKNNYLFGNASAGMYGAVVIGNNNTTRYSGGDIQLFGYGNETNMQKMTLIGHENGTTAATNSLQSGTYNYAIGYQNKYENLTSSVYPQYTVMLGNNNTISNMAPSGAVLIGSRNSIRSSASPNIASQAMYFFGRGLSNVVSSASTQDNYTITCAVGKYNACTTLEDLPFVVGMGDADSAASRRNGLSISSTGTLNVNGSVNTNGADYAEYFEWADGNPEAEDRVGYAVTLEGKKIRIANADDDVIGFISGTAAAVGEDAPWNWHGRDVRDEFGRVQYEEKEFTEEVPDFDEEGNEIGTKTISIVKTVPVQNSKWNPEEQYIPRKFRSEWDTVGLLGKLYVRDDGSCEVGGYAVVVDGGIVAAAPARTNMRVLERVTENVVRVLFK